MSTEDFRFLAVFTAQNPDHDRILKPIVRYLRNCVLSKSISQLKRDPRLQNFPEHSVNISNRTIGENVDSSGQSSSQKASNENLSNSNNNPDQADADDDDASAQADTEDNNGSEGVNGRDWPGLLSNSDVTSGAKPANGGQDKSCTEQAGGADDHIDAGQANGQDKSCTEQAGGADDHIDAGQANGQADDGSDDGSEQANGQADDGSDDGSEQANGQADDGSDDGSEQANVQADDGSDDGSEQANGQADDGSDDGSEQANVQADDGSDDGSEQANGEEKRLTKSEADFIKKNLSEDLLKNFETASQSLCGFWTSSWDPVQPGQVFAVTAISSHANHISLKRETSQLENAIQAVINARRKAIWLDQTCRLKGDTGIMKEYWKHAGLSGNTREQEKHRSRMRPGQFFALYPALLVYFHEDILLLSKPEYFHYRAKTLQRWFFTQDPRRLLSIEHRVLLLEMAFVLRSLPCNAVQCLTNFDRWVRLSSREVLSSAETLIDQRFQSWIAMDHQVQNLTPSFFSQFCIGESRETADVFMLLDYISYEAIQRQLSWPFLQDQAENFTSLAWPAMNLPSRSSGLYDPATLNRFRNGIIQSDQRSSGLDLLASAASRVVVGLRCLTQSILKDLSVDNSKKRKSDALHDTTDPGETACQQPAAARSFELESEPEASRYLAKRGCHWNYSLPYSQLANNSEIIGQTTMHRVADLEPLGSEFQPSTAQFAPDVSLGFEIGNSAASSCIQTHIPTTFISPDLSAPSDLNISGHTHDVDLDFPSNQLPTQSVQRFIPTALRQPNFPIEPTNEDRTFMDPNFNYQRRFEPGEEIRMYVSTTLTDSDAQAINQGQAFDSTLNPAEMMWT